MKDFNQTDTCKQGHIGGSYSLKNGERTAIWKGEGIYSVYWQRT